MNQERESWADYFFRICHDVASRSTCCRRKVGAVVINHGKRIIGTGYNGAPSGLRHCSDETCVRNVRKIPSGQMLETCKAVHAETNAVLAAGSRIGEICAVFVTNQPCTSCLKLLMSIGVELVAWDNPYDDPYSMELMREYGEIIGSGHRKFLLKKDAGGGRDDFLKKLVG